MKIRKIATAVTIACAVGTGVAHGVITQPSPWVNIGYVQAHTTSKDMRILLKRASKPGTKSTYYAIALKLFKGTGVPTTKEDK